MEEDEEEEKEKKKEKEKIGYLGLWQGSDYRNKNIKKQK